MKSKVCKASFSGSDKEPTKFSSVITTSAVDRDQEVVVPSGMNSKDYERNPVLLYAHDPNKPIGKMLTMRRGESSIDADFVLAPRPESHEGEWLPDTIGSLMRFGALNGVSIQFAPIDGGMRRATKADTEKYGAGVKTVYSKWKLLEVSVVSIPANQDALISAVSKGICTRESLAALGCEPLPTAVPEATVTPRVKHRVTILMPAIGTDEVAQIARLALARARGTFR